MRGGAVFLPAAGARCAAVQYFYRPQAARCAAVQYFYRPQGLGVLRCSIPAVGKCLAHTDAEPSQTTAPLGTFYSFMRSTKPQSYLVPTQDPVPTKPEAAESAYFIMSSFNHREKRNSVFVEFSDKRSHLIE